MDFFAFMAEEGTIYQVGVGLGTLEDAIISLHGPYPEYGELYTANSRENGQTTSLYWQSTITDMVFVQVTAEGGTGDYSFFVQPVNLDDDHANFRGKGTALSRRGGSVGRTGVPWRRGRLPAGGRRRDGIRGDPGPVETGGMPPCTWRDIYGKLVASAAADKRPQQGLGVGSLEGGDAGVPLHPGAGTQHRRLLPSRSGRGRTTTEIPARRPRRCRSGST